MTPCKGLILAGIIFALGCSIGIFIYTQTIRSVKVKPSILVNQLYFKRFSTLVPDNYQPSELHKSSVAIVQLF